MCLFMDERMKFGLVASSSFLAFGFWMLITGSALPAIVSEFNISYKDAGILLSLPTFGFIFGAILCMVFVQKTGPFKLLSFALISVSLSLAWISASRVFWMLVIASVVMSVGSGLIETTVGVGVSSIRYRRTGGALNFIHSAYAIGAIVSPFVVALLLTTSDRWWVPFVLACLLSLMVFFYSTSLKIGWSPSITKSRKREYGYLLRQPVFWLAIIGVFVYVGYEVAFTSWLSAYVYDVKGITMRLSSIFPALLWAGLFIGRVMSGAFVDRLGYAYSLLLLTSLSSISVVAVLFSRSPMTLVIAVVISGIGFSGVFPTLQAIMIRGLSSAINEAISIFSIAASLGAAFANYAVGAIGDVLGLGWGIAFVLLLIVIELILALILMQRGEKKCTT